ncbi:MAG: S49 family peptidase [Nitrospirae bacterium]|nr:S49 family peptidase [Nitrospirota bacterium]
MRAFWKTADTAWAMRPEMLETIVEIALRENESPEAVAKRLGRPLDNTYAVTVRDGVAVLPVTGPLFRRANLFTQVSGATSYDLLARDFQRAVEDPQIRAIVMELDSPGGEVNGIAELADQVHAARDVKPVVAYVSGMAASGGYWIASAASEIITAETAELGSIGVAMAHVSADGRDEKAGVRRIVTISSQSPDKNRPPTDDHGRELAQRRVDALAGVFVGKVARNRGVPEATVLSDFGRGDVLVGNAAVAAGLADRLGSLEGIIAELAANHAPAGGGFAHAEEVVMTDTHTAGAESASAPEITAALIREHHPAVAETFRAEGAVAGEQAARERIAAILRLPEAEGRDGLAKHIAFATTTDLDGARAMLAAAPKENKQADLLAAAMAGVENPQVGMDAGEGTDYAAAAVIAAGRELGVVAGR